MLIENMIEKVVSTTTMSSASELQGFEIDLWYALETAGFTNVRVDRTGNPRCMLRADALAPAGVEGYEVVHRLRTVWSDVHYRVFEAAEVNEGTDAIRLRFVTAVPTVQLGVTGEIVVRLSSSDNETSSEGKMPMTPSST
jgi:hypothetical protein